MNEHGNIYLGEEFVMNKKKKHIIMSIPKGYKFAMVGVGKAGLMQADKKEFKRKKERKKGKDQIKNELHNEY